MSVLRNAYEQTVNTYLRFFFQVDFDFAPAVQGFAQVLGNGERAVGFGFPDPLFVVVVVLGPYGHEIRDEVHGVEPHTELPNQIHVAAFLHGVQKRAGSRFRDGAEIFFQLGFGHPHAAVADGYHPPFLVNFDFDFQLLCVTNTKRVGVR
jgi:hypothetical protein